MDTSPRNIQIKYKSGYFPHQYSDQMKVWILPTPTVSLDNSHTKIQIKLSLDTLHTNIQVKCKYGYFPTNIQIKCKSGYFSYQYSDQM